LQQNRSGKGNFAVNASVIENYPSALFRKKFTLADTSGLSDMELELQMDDGAIVYLNGKEIFRSNMPEGTVSFTTNSTEVNDQVTVYTKVAKESFLIGENVIACEVHQYSGTSSDLGFDISLSYTVVEESTGCIYSEQALIQSDTSFTIALEPVFEPIDAIPGVYLNEIAPVTEYFRDEYEEKLGFIELYNSTGADIALFNFFISDDAGNLYVSIHSMNPYALNYSIDVIDISGKMRFPKVWLNSSKNYINLSHLNRGLYFVRVFIYNRMILTSKMIIIK
jgi:hypothetical protein